MSEARQDHTHARRNATGRQLLRKQRKHALLLISRYLVKPLSQLFLRWSANKRAGSGVNINVGNQGCHWFLRCAEPDRNVPSEAFFYELRLGGIKRVSDIGSQPTAHDAAGRPGVRNRKRRRLCLNNSVLVSSFHCSSRGQQVRPAVVCESFLSCRSF